MAKYLVTYHESHSNEYEVEADSIEEAEGIVKQEIYNGKRNAPENCYDSGCETRLLE